MCLGCVVVAFLMGFGFWGRCRVGLNVAKRLGGKPKKVVH